MVRQLFGTAVFHDYEWNFEGKRFVATHGDRFDKFIVNNPRLSILFGHLYRLLQVADLAPKKHVSRLVKRMSKKIYLSKTISEDMLAYARNKAVDVIFCGHTHHADRVVAADGIEYYNTGCWTDIPSTYLTISKKGVHTHEVW
jgi:UDP-2,3-diacylglucosamine pyrophosphatase LpxH